MLLHCSRPRLSGWNEALSPGPGSPPSPWIDADCFAAAGAPLESLSASSESLAANDSDPVALCRTHSEQYGRRWLAGPAGPGLRALEGHPKARDGGVSDERTGARDPEDCHFCHGPWPVRLVQGPT